MSVTITCVEVPAGAEAVVAPQPGVRLHRALAPDARFRWIAVGDARPAVHGDDSVTVHSAPFEVIHAARMPAAPFDPAATGSVIFVNCIVFEPGVEDAAFAAWKRVNDYMVAKPGYRGHTLHRRLDDSAPFGFVNVVEWESPQAWAAAHDDGFRALTQPAALPFTTIPTLCELVDAGELAGAGELFEAGDAAAGR